jgi:hypothetical protein
MATAYIKRPLHIPNGHYIYVPNGHKEYRHLPLQDPPKFIQIWIFGLKICHLATLRATQVVSRFILPPQSLDIRLTTLSNRRHHHDFIPDRASLASSKTKGEFYHGNLDRWMEHIQASGRRGYIIKY